MSIVSCDSRQEQTLWLACSRKGLPERQISFAWQAQAALMFGLIFLMSASFFACKLSKIGTKIFNAGTNVFFL
jgi:hypothetical protein